MQLGNRFSQHSFAQIPSVNMARSQFDRSFGVKDAWEFDLLTPIFVDEILPGDTCNLTMKQFTRLATQLAPTMDNMMVDYFFFFVPNRLVWDNWEKFNGAQDNPGDSTDFLIPTVSPGVSQSWTVGSMADKFGIPTGVNNIKTNSLPFRAYRRIIFDWFRDQNLDTMLPLEMDNGPDDPTLYSLFRRNKAHDYFTSALPWPQKGPAIEIPLGTSAPVVTNTMPIMVNTPTVTGRFLQRGSMAGSYNNTVGVSGADLGAGTQNLSFGAQTGLQADLSSATAPTVNEIREAFMMQSLLELDARGGTRYTEILLNHFNVMSPDFRLQRAEYLGGGRSYINSHPVAQQSASSGGGTPQANLASFGTAATDGRDNIGFTKSFVEHGYVIGLACARADLTYQQGLNRMWSRQTRWDFFWPKLQQLGEQTILRKELYTLGTADDDLVFGYQERYAEYRYRGSEIHGKMRSTDPQSLDYWHLAEEFQGPSFGLNSAFIKSNTPIDRVLAVTDEPALISDYFFDYKHARPMATYSVPATLGRF